MDNIYLFYLLLFTVAMLYSSVGHGGASGYLALMAIYAFSPAVMKPTALILNLFVSLTSFIQFYRGEHFKWKIFLPLALASIPLAFLGGLILMEASVYKKILGVLLFIPVIRFLFFSNIPDSELKKNSVMISVLIGSLIGFISGLIGIGGGIILSPIQTAAISALFIFVNSLSGLAGQLTKGITFSPDMLSYVGIAFAGGLCGAYLGALKFNQNVLKNTLAIVLMMAGWKLIFT
jgi:uncharacterized membrane protein YfcA